MMRINGMMKVSMMRISLVALLVSTAAIGFFYLSGTAFGNTLEPWWGLSVGERPAGLSGAEGRDEVLNLTVSATGGLYLIEHEGRPSILAFNASAIEVQSKLEEVYPGRRIEVSGGPGDGPGSKPYRIVFPDQAVEPFEAPVQALTCEPGVEHCTGTATVNVEQNGVGSGNQLYVVVENLGDANANGGVAPVKIEDTLPAGLEVLSVEGQAGAGGSGSEEGVCSGASGSGRTVACTFGGVTKPYEVIEVRVAVRVEHSAGSSPNSITVSGGGATRKSVTRTVTIGGGGGFGVEELSFAPERVGGQSDTQAGSHPFQVTGTFTLSQGSLRYPAETPARKREVSPIALPKDVNVLSPAGLIGNPNAFAQCTDQEFVLVVEEHQETTRCPLGSVIGVAVVTLDEPKELGMETSTKPLFNLIPHAGEPARFGFYAGPVPVMVDTSVRSGGDYGVTVSSHNISEIVGVLRSSITLWGVPGDPQHDGQRGYGCLLHEEALCPLGQSTIPPFISMPTSCGTPLQASVQADSWADPTTVLSSGLTEPLPALDGCNHLPFNPSVSVAPDVPDASTPTGLEVKVHVPQTSILNAEGPAEGTVRDATVALPAGLQTNAGGADGLEACDEGEVGFLGKDTTDAALNLFTPVIGEPFCPSASKIGTVEVETPLLPNKLEGAVYLASPAPAEEAGLNPFNSLLAMYIVVQDPVSGTLIKLAGKVALNPANGQLTSTFEDTPQLPFENLRLHFFGGSRAPLATPAFCGAYTTAATFVPWSFEEGSQPAQASSTFQITSGPNGSACAEPRPFQPEFHASSSNLQAGAYTPLSTTIGHPDADQVLGGLAVKFPPGLLGSLSGVKLCGEPQAAEGTCGPESLIGHTTVTAGLGSTPAVVKRPGSVYITGPYGGAPFGLSIVNPAETGPFDLEKGTPCDCVVVRAKVQIDPHTAQLSVVSDPFPTILQGVPLNLQHINVTVERPAFTFNPTNCNRMSATGTVSSGEGAVAAVVVPFQVTDCAALKFAPKFSASTPAKSSRLNGTSLSVELAQPKAPFGSQANIASAKVELPKRLPSRLKTLQKACTNAQFEANPAGCPRASVVGHAIVHTPILPVPLEGPAIFVSHGGEAFPSLTMVLQGYGVTIDLVGTTSISKRRVTSTTFKAVPDTPFSTFELTLPAGRYSALTGIGNLCSHKLVMPTEFVAQNGRRLDQNTVIAVKGCHKRRHHRAHSHRRSARTVHRRH